MKSKTLFYLILLTIFVSLIPVAHAQTYSVIHSFTAAEGSPAAGVTIRGNALYGITNNRCGTVFQLTHPGSSWLFSTLSVFSYPQGCGHYARVVFGPDGHLYGTSGIGGKNNAGNVFKLTPPVGPCKDAACYWTVNSVHDFGSDDDGYNPGHGELTWDQQGNMFGTTYGGGTSNWGTVYVVRPSGDGYTESVLYNFPGPPEGASPRSGVVFDNQGNLFGSTEQGGLYNIGAVFELTYVSGVGWTEHVLYSFLNFSDGLYPWGGPILDSSGNLYGTTATGGDGGGGSIFELSPSSGMWRFEKITSFFGEFYRDCGSRETFTRDGRGNLYGTTTCDARYGAGDVFKLTDTEYGWVFTTLHDFTNGTDEGYPISNVSIDTDGTLYGTSARGGVNGYGVVWMIKP